MFAVVISLLFVAYSVNQNTQALQGTNDNIIFEQHAELTDHFIADSSMAAIRMKVIDPGAELDEIETLRWEQYRVNQLDIWATAYNRHSQGLLNEKQWQAWDTYFIYLFTKSEEKLNRESWQYYSYGYDPDFWAHVKTSLYGGN